ncbi:putative opsin [Lactarius quietus]|nr:putative opsin [Lactarius quietus]
MANASAKRIASQNEAAIKNMLYGQLLCNLVPAIIRILLRGQSFRDSKKAIVFYFLSLALSQFLYQHLKKLGTPRRDSKDTLVSSGDDLNQPGMTEWMFDILYISWFAQVGASIVGEWFWWIYLVIPGFLVYKLWGFISPMVFGRSSALPEDEPKQEGLSKRQEKLKKRSERGDPRVKTQARK